MGLPLWEYVRSVDLNRLSPKPAITSPIKTVIGLIAALPIIRADRAVRENSIASPFDDVGGDDCRYGKILRFLA